MRSVRPKRDRESGPSAIRFVPVGSCGDCDVCLREPPVTNSRAPVGTVPGERRRGSTAETGLVVFYRHFDELRVPTVVTVRWWREVIVRIAGIRVVMAGVHLPATPTVVQIWTVLSAHSMIQCVTIVFIARPSLSGLFRREDGLVPAKTVSPPLAVYDSYLRQSGVYCRSVVPLAGGAVSRLHSGPSPASADTGLYAPLSMLVGSHRTVRSPFVARS